MKPAPPVNLSHVQTIEAQLILRWADPDFKTAIGYEVRYSPEGSRPAWQVTKTPVLELLEPFESLPAAFFVVVVSPGQVCVWRNQDVSGAEAQRELHRPGPPLQPAPASAVERLEPQSPHLPGQ